MAAKCVGTLVKREVKEERKRYRCYRVSMCQAQMKSKIVSQPYVTSSMTTLERQINWSYFILLLDDLQSLIK